MMKPWHIVLNKGKMEVVQFLSYGMGFMCPWKSSVEKDFP